MRPVCYSCLFLFWKRTTLDLEYKPFFCEVPNYKFTRRRAVSRSNIMLVVAVHCIWFNLGSLTGFMFSLCSSSNSYPAGYIRNRTSSNLGLEVRMSNISLLLQVPTSPQNAHVYRFRYIKLVSSIYFLYISATETDGGNDNAGREISERPLFC